MCTTCLGPYVLDKCENAHVLANENDGCIACCYFSSGCTSTFTPSELGPYLTPDVYDRYNKTIVEAKLVPEMERNFERRIAALRKEMADAHLEQSAVDHVNQHIADNILTLKCPRCSAELHALQSRFLRMVPPRLR